MQNKRRNRRLDTRPEPQLYKAAKLNMLYGLCRTTVWRGSHRHWFRVAPSLPRRTFGKLGFAGVNGFLTPTGSTRISAMEAIDAHIDAKQGEFVQLLSESVAIASVSGSVSHRPEVHRMGHWLKSKMEALGIAAEARSIGKQILEGKELDLPPVILGTYGTDPQKKTLLVYGHYDVQPAEKEDGWGTDPFVLTEDNQGRMYGRGSTDDKGPVLGWLCAIKSYQDLGMDLPVNMKFCFEGMEESGSEGLDDLIIAEAKKYFDKVDVVCISDNYWLGKNKPCLTYGLRGVSYFHVSVKGPANDLHSGVFGETVHEPMTDLVHIMSRLVKPDGTILVERLMDDVAPVTDAERATYNGLDFNHEDFHATLGSETTLRNTEMETLMHRWRYPSLSLHGIQGAFSAPGSKTVIPAKVVGKFSIRTVPNQDPDRITRVVTEYIKKEFQKLGSKNRLHVECGHAGRWWLASPEHPNFVAAANAIEQVFGMQPNLIREGGSIPVTLTFQEALQKNVCLLPMGACDDGAHSANEKLDRRNFIQGIKVFARYLQELAKTEGL